MRRGDLVTIAVSGDYGKSRPALIVQADDFDEHLSVTVLPLTTEIHEAPLFRIPVSAGASTGLRKASQIMVDKLTTVPRKKIGARMGRVDSATMQVVNRALTGFLAL